MRKAYQSALKYLLGVIVLVEIHKYHYQLKKKSQNLSAAF